MYVSAMVKWCLVIGLVQFGGVFSSCGHRLRKVVRVGFQGVRGNESSRSTQLPSSFQHLEGQLPCDRLVFCTDSEYPNDALCDIEGLKSDPRWEGVGILRELKLFYPHPSNPDTTCNIVLSPIRKKSSRFTFKLAQCSQLIADETLPRFNFSSVTSLVIYADHRDLFNTALTMKLVSDDLDRRGYASIVVYKLSDVTYGFNYNAINGRRTTNYGHDGRRVRPN